MAGEFLDIPGDIKQMFLPFVLNSDQKCEYADKVIKNKNLSSTYQNTRNRLSVDDKNYKEYVTNIINNCVEDFTFFLPNLSLCKNVETEYFQNKYTFIDIYENRNSIFGDPKAVSIVEDVFKSFKETDMSNNYTKTVNYYLKDNYKNDKVQYYFTSDWSIERFSFAKWSNHTWNELESNISIKLHNNVLESIRQYALSRTLTVTSEIYKNLANITSKQAYMNILNGNTNEESVDEFAFGISCKAVLKRSTRDVWTITVNQPVKLSLESQIIKKISAMWLERDRTNELKNRLAARIKEHHSEITDQLEQAKKDYDQQFNFLQKYINGDIYNDIKCQVFTFKSNSYLINQDSWSADQESAGYLKVLPSSFYLHSGSGKNLDQSLKFRAPNDNDVTEKKFDYIHSILNEAPSIIIREYLQDAKLNQVMSLFSEFGKSFIEQKDSNKKTGFLTKLFGGIVNGAKVSSQMMFNIDKLVEYAFHGTLGKCKINLSTPDSYDDFVVRVPYMLYYQFLASTTTNIYEIPYNGKVIYTSNGSSGWKNGHLVNSAGMNSSGALVSGAIGKLVNYIGSNIRINTTPSWEGGDSDRMTVDVDFTLFNDSLDAALKNFIFVNTIVPGNMWMQYHIFQHAPDVYDICIDGVNRLFMCSANFSVDQVGVLRKPSDEFVRILKDKHLNQRFSKKVKDTSDMLNNIRIPDAYAVKCTFTSLLPNNFNNYLYRFWQTDKITVPKIKEAHEDSMLGEVAEKFGRFIATAWDSTLDGNEVQAKRMKNEVFMYDTSTETGKKRMCDAVESIFKEIDRKKNKK